MRPSWPNSLRSLRRSGPVSHSPYLSRSACPVIPASLSLAILLASALRCAGVFGASILAAIVALLTGVTVSRTYRQGCDVATTILLATNGGAVALCEVAAFPWPLRCRLLPEQLTC